MAINPKNVNKQYILCGHFSGCPKKAVNVVSISGTDSANLDYMGIDHYCQYHTESARKHAINRGLSYCSKRIQAPTTTPPPSKKTKQVVIGTGAMGFDLSYKARDWLREHGAEDGIKGDMPGKRGEYSIERDYEGPGKWQNKTRSTAHTNDRRAW